MTGISTRLGVTVFVGQPGVKKKGTTKPPTRTPNALLDQRGNPLRDQQGRILEAQSNGKVR